MGGDGVMTPKGQLNTYTFMGQVTGAAAGASVRSFAEGEQDGVAREVSESFSLIENTGT